MAFVACLAAASYGTAAHAHEGTYPIAGDSLSIVTDPEAENWSFSFSTQGQEALSLAHDPSQEGFSLLVSGVGDSGSGRTVLIELDRAFWSPGTEAGSWVYADPSGQAGGVTDVTLGVGSTSIQASGVNWSWDMSGPQASVWVQFWIEGENFCANFSEATGASISQNTGRTFSASQAAVPGSCPTPFCGNNRVEVGESCDDGNFHETDGCTSQCQIGVCDSPEFDTTWQALQSLVLDGNGCQSCHGAQPLNNDLVLTSEQAYSNLVGVPSHNAFNDEKLVEPGEPRKSFLYSKLGAKTIGPIDDWIAPDEGSAMPSAFAALTLEHLEALRMWILAGAPEFGVVDGTAAYLAACLPPPTPLKAPVPDPPQWGTGVQLLQTPWPLPGLETDPNGEDEICMATYYDFTQTDLIDEDYQVDCPGVFGVNNPSNKCFLYHQQILIQDGQSHHSIIHIYRGDDEVGPDDVTSGAGFGPFTFKAGDLEGESCDPTQVDPSLGYNPNCSGRIVSSPACLLGFGPPDYNAATCTGGFGGICSPQFSGSQEAYSERLMADGVYAVLPMQGAVAWNSHAFNLTQIDSTMDQYLNIYLAEEGDRLYPARGIFDASHIFSQNVLPYQTQEICATYLLPQGAYLYNLNSHTHRHGVRWRTWLPPNQPCAPGPLGNGCSPREDFPDYLSTTYTDPLDLNFPEPLFFDSPNEADRTLLFCSLYDNGSTPDSPEVKRFSESPSGPAGINIPGAGPCNTSTIACYGGANYGELCHGNDSECDGGICDACPVRGGLTTEDEMFLFLGSYYIGAPEPSAGLLTLGSLICLVYFAARRRTAVN